MERKLAVLHRLLNLCHVTVGPVYWPVLAGTRPRGRDTFQTGRSSPNHHSWCHRAAAGASWDCPGGSAERRWPCLNLQSDLYSAFVLRNIQIYNIVRECPNLRPGALCYVSSVADPPPATNTGVPLLVRGEVGREVNCIFPALKRDTNRASIE